MRAPLTTSAAAAAARPPLLRTAQPYVQRQPRLKIIRLSSTEGGTPGGAGAHSNAQQIADALRDMFQRSQFSEAGWH